MNISNFITWFIQQFYNIGTTMLQKLDQITIHNNISLMDFIITIAIIGAFIQIIITAPNLGIVNREINARAKGNARNEKIRRKNTK